MTSMNNERKLAITATGKSDFGKLSSKEYFYIDKTLFIKEWWESGDEVTLITRPRRFGKTLTMSMLEHFFSIDYKNKGEEHFGHFNIWKESYYQQLQGTYPVLNLSFAKIKEKNFENAKVKFYNILINLYNQHNYLMKDDFLSETERLLFTAIRPDMKEPVATDAIYQLSLFLHRYYGKKIIILLDEYDTPMQEAYVYGYWDEMVQFMRSLFGATFKSNIYLERAIMTGITRVSKESIFSDLNNLKVITTTSNVYSTAFGFTEGEVFQALDEYNLSEKKEEVKLWYNGFTFGKHFDIYNPWSIINLLSTKECNVYWANTSSNTLISNLVQKASEDIKMSFEQLLKGETIEETIDEQIIFNYLDNDELAIWSLLLASGYLKVNNFQKKTRFTSKYTYTLSITNLETLCMFHDIVRGWFAPAGRSSSKFLNALRSNDVETMNYYMNDIALKTFSSFDTGKKSSKKEPERFYHGFVLGLLVELQDEYTITSNGESGNGRYDIVLKPLDNKKKNAYVFEFKVCTLKTDKTLKKTAQIALDQIKEKQYTTTLLTEGYANIHTYGFAFRGKEVLIKKGE